LITESPVASPADRSKWAEMLFESYRVPSIYIANSSALSLFASGRTTGLVVECGAGVTSSVPVFEGLALQHAATTVNYAGQDVSQKIKALLGDNNCSIDLGYARMLKERLAYVRTDGAETDNNEKVNFSLPDGTDVSVNKGIFGDCTEKLFHNIDAEPNGMVYQAYETLQLCDDSLQKDLANNVVISGGSSMLPGLFYCLLYKAAYSILLGVLYIMSSILLICRVWR
jgi:actin, other eukaryote